MLFRTYFLKSIRIIAGLLLIAFGVFISKQCFCLAPWNVLSDGVSSLLGISIGTASIIISVMIITIDVVSREKLGFGSLLNVFLLGLFTDMFLEINRHLTILPRIENVPLQILFCIVSLFFNGLGIYLYMSARMGAGPRDTLMVHLSRKLHFPSGYCRLGLEFIAGLSGWLLGGEVGVGTVVSVFLGGPILQLVFQAFKYDPSAVESESFSDTLHNISKKIYFI